MKTIGLREFKNKLGAFVRLVKQGEAIYVTDRGQIIAELRPYVKAELSPFEQRIRRLVTEGLIVQGDRQHEGLHGLPSIPRDEAAPSGTAGQLLDELREERL